MVSLHVLDIVAPKLALAIAAWVAYASSGWVATTLLTGTGKLLKLLAWLLYYCAVTAVIGVTVYRVLLYWFESPAYSPLRWAETALTQFFWDVLDGHWLTLAKKLLSLAWSFTTQWLYTHLRELYHVVVPLSENEQFL